MANKFGGKEKDLQIKTIMAKFKLCCTSYSVGNEIKSFGVPILLIIGEIISELVVASRAVFESCQSEFRCRKQYKVKQLIGCFPTLSNMKRKNTHSHLTLMRSRSITMKPTHILLITMLSTASTAWGQQGQFIQIGTRQGTVSIYEYGDSLISCETNFENLFRNWTKENITNAGEYHGLESYSFIETISDSVRYKYYRNFFSGLEVVNYYYRDSKSGIYNGKEWVETKEYRVYPLTRKFMELHYCPPELMIKLIELYSTDSNFDLNFNLASKQLKEEHYREDGCNSSRKTKSGLLLITYTDSITQMIADSIVSLDYDFEELSAISQEQMILSYNKLLRGAGQKDYDESVQIGDRVYMIPFRFGPLPYKVYVVCNPKSNKVVLDYFFKGIKF